MSDKPANTEAEVKPPAKPGEPPADAKPGFEKTLAQNEATKRLFAAASPGGTHAPLETAPGKPVVEDRSWSLSSLTASAENAVSNWMKPAEKPAVAPVEKSSLPSVQLVTDKPAPALPENASLGEKVVYAFTYWSATKKEAIGTIKEYTSGDKSFYAKATAVGGALIAGAAFLTPEGKALRQGVKGFEALTAAERAAGAVSAETNVGAKSFQAFLKSEGGLAEAKLAEPSTFAAAEKAATAAPAKPAEIKLSLTEFEPKIAAEPKPGTLAGLHVDETHANVPRFVAKEAQPETFHVSGAEVAHPLPGVKPHSVAPEGAFSVDSKLASPAPSKALVDAPNVRSVAPEQSHPVSLQHPDAIEAPKPAPRVGELEAPVHVERPAPTISSVQSIEAPKPLPSHVQSVEAPKPLPSHVQSVEAPKPLPSHVQSVEAPKPLPSHVQSVEAPKPLPSHVQSVEAEPTKLQSIEPLSPKLPSEGRVQLNQVSEWPHPAGKPQPIGAGEPILPADLPAPTPVAKLAPSFSRVELHESAGAVKPAAAADSLEASKPTTAAVKLDAPSERITEPEAAAAVHTAEHSTARFTAAMNTDASRAASNVAETQIVSHSNTLAERVHKLELPVNAAPELQAAKGRLAESSLTFSQSEHKAQVLKGMQADLKVLEKSFSPEALAEVRHNIAEMQSSTAVLEPSTANTAEAQIAKVDSVEGTLYRAENSQVLKNGSTEQVARVRQGETVEAPTANAAKLTHTLSQTQTPTSALAQAPHAVSIQTQSLDLLAHSDVPKAGREALSKIIQDTNNWGAKSLVERSEAASRLDANLKLLRADAGTAKDLSALTKSVESLKAGTNAEAAALKVDREVTSSLVTEPQIAAPGTLSRTNALRADADVAYRDVRLGNLEPHAKLSPADTSAAKAAIKHDLDEAAAQLRGHSTTLQKQALDAIEKGGLEPQTRKALVNVVQDSGNLERLEGAERAGALKRIEQNLNLAAEDKAFASDAQKFGTTFKSVESSSIKAQQLQKLDQVASQALPRIADDTAALRKSNFENPTPSSARVSSHLNAIEKDAASLASPGGKSLTLSRMQGEVDGLEGVLGKEAVAPLRDNVNRIEMAYSDSARANKLEEAAAKSAASQESLTHEMQTISRSDAKLSPTGRAAADEIHGLTSSNQRLGQAEIARLREGVAAVSKDVDPAVGARLNGHVYNIETNFQLGQLDRTLANVAQDTATVNRQAALAAARNSAPAVATLHQATEALKLNGVAELSAARVAYEKALPALGREDAISINRSLSRIENQAVEAHSWKRQIVEAQQSHIARVERDAHLQPAGETQRAREIQQLVVSSRDGVEKKSLEQVELSRNTSQQVVFKPAFNAVSDAPPVSGLASIGSRLAQIRDAANRIAVGFSDTILGLRTHPVATSLSLGMGAFMVESGRAMAQTPADNRYQPTAGQIDFSPRAQSVQVSTENSSVHAKANVVDDRGVQQPLVRGMLAAEYASLSPTMQALLRTSEGGIDPTNGQRVRFGNSFFSIAAQSGVPDEVVAKAAVYARVIKASTISVGQPDSTDKDRSRIFYPPFKSPMASISARIRKPNLLGIETASLANSTSFLTSKLSPNSTSLTNPLNFTREKADSGSEDRGNSGAVTTGVSFDLAKNGLSTSTALLNAAAPDPNAQTASQSVVSES
jgi:hypothetical protein